MNPDDRYLRYLPPVLWQGEQPMLPCVLKIFEKILTGIDNHVDADHLGRGGDRHAHRGIAEVIDALPDLFSPEWTEERFLGWLAGWVGLELQASWDERQRRQAIAEIVRIYGRRGSKAGLTDYLNLHAANAERQRMVVDDGSKILFSRPRTGEEVAVHALLSQGLHIRPDKTIAYPGLISPRSLALSPDGELLVTDDGAPGTTPHVPGVWRITSTGDYADWTGTPPVPTPLSPPDMTLTAPVVLAVQRDPGGAGWSLFVLDNDLKLFRVASANPLVAERLRVTLPPGLITTAMTVDAGHLLILDRGGEIVELDLAADPLVPTSHPLVGVLEPRSMLITRDGRLIVGDAREQNAPTPADLVLVDRSDPGSWVGTPLLSSLSGTNNPLVAPYGVVEDHDGSFLVLDAGLKPDFPPTRPYLRTVVEPAAVYRVRLDDGTARITRATKPGQLVHPTGMVLHDGVVYLSDGGDPNDPAVTANRHNFRAHGHEFGVITHFDADTATAEYQHIVTGGINEIVGRERPASTLPTFLSAIGGGS